MPADVALTMANALVSTYPMAFRAQSQQQQAAAARAGASLGTAQQVTANANSQGLAATRDGVSQAAEARYQQALQFAMARQADVQKHEMAHHTAAAQFSGGIHYGYSTLQVPMGNGEVRTINYISTGSVPVRMPSTEGLSPEQLSQPGATTRLQQLQSQFRQVAFAASAPEQMSAADASVMRAATSGAEKVAAMMAQAQQLQLNRTHTSGQNRQHLASVGNRLNVVG